MSSNYFQTTIGNQITLQRGFDITKKQQIPGDIPVVSSGGIASYHNEAKVDGPGVVLGRKGSLGTVFYLDSSFWPHDTSLWVKDFKGNNPRFVYYFFTSIAEKLKGMDVGAANPALNRNHVHPMEVIWPKREVQDDIVALLGILDDKVMLNNQTNQTLEQMAQAIFKSWFVDFDPVKAKMNGEQPEGMDAATASLFPEKLVESELGLIPEGWKVKKIGDVVERYSVGKKYSQKTAVESGLVPILDQGKSGIIGYHNDNPGVKASLDNPIIVFANHTCYMKLVTYDFSAIQNVLPFKLNGCDIYWSYLATQGKQKFVEYKGHWPDFMIHEIVIPSEELMQHFGELVKPFYSQMASNENQNKSLAKLRDTLLPKLLSGEIELEVSSSLATDKIVDTLLDNLDFGIKFKPSQQSLPKGYIGLITVSGTFGSNGGTHVHVPTAIKALSELTGADGAYSEIAGNIATETLMSGTVEIVTNNVIPLGVLTKVCTAVFGKKTPIKPRDAVLLTTIHEAKDKSIDCILNDQAKRFAFLELPPMDERELEQSLQYLESIGVVKGNGKTIVLLDSVVQH